MMKKEIIILSDIEMGAGNITDDFIADKTLSALIKKLAKKKHAIDLIFNGDTFDFLKSPYKLKPSKYTRHVTKEVALDKIKLACTAHKEVFNALKDFVSHKDKTVIFIRGNHDLEIAYPQVQYYLQKLLGSKEYVKFPGLFYRHNGLYVEHGQQYDSGNFLPPKQLFLRYRGGKILNNTFVAFGVITGMIPMKERHPFFERIKPWPVMMTLHKPIGKEVNRTVIKYFLKGLFYYPLRYYTDPTHSFPRSLIREFLWRARQWNWEIQDIVPLVKRKKRDKIIVLGHLHEFHVDRGKQVIIQLSSWRDEYELNEEERTITPMKKRYVKIISDHSKLKWKVITLPQKRKPYKFTDVVKNEMHFIEQAKKDENATQQNIKI